MEKVSPTIIIVGITGDLSEKKLLPALYGLAERGLLGDTTRIIGTSRRSLSNEDILPKLSKDPGDTTLDWLDHHLTTITADPGTLEGARTLADYVKDDDNMRLFYFSIPPNTFENVITSMAEASLNGERDYLLVEKPFGRSGSTAKKLHDLTDRHYSEANIYRVDHYLAKPGVRSISESGALILDPRRILSLDIRSDEALDIEGRADFYEQAGALRDVIQSHLLQVLALCMSAYKAHTTGAIHQDLKARVLEDLEVLGAFRAQYAGYRDEANNPESYIETYAALELTSSDHAWRDVRITVRSGKALPAKKSDITVTFADKTTHVFDMNDNPAHILDGYEQVLYDAAQSNRSLFLSARDVDESWRIVDPTLESWARNGSGLAYYKKGTIPATTI
jgi:glucose-6-phosphate 1-dehydrogenase